ncbi:MAG: DUF4423 domain-containing protein [Myxococcota bacterium]
MDQAATQMLRALRGTRSQVAFARRLGYRRNPVCDWEHARSFPTAEETLRAAQVVGVDVHEAFAGFATIEVGPPTTLDAAGLADWLSRLRGSRPLGEVAERTGVSRFVVSRWLAGQTRPRLPDFLRLVEALTGRLSDWVARLVPIEQVPALRDSYERRVASRRLAVDVPWSEAVVRVLETAPYAALPAHRPGWIADRLGIDAQTEAACLQALEQAGTVAWDGARYKASAPITVDTRPAPEVVAALKGHWARVGQERTAAPRPADLLSYNVISLSRADLARLRELHLAYYRDVRALVAASEPVEVAALLNVQLVTFE